MKEPPIRVVSAVPHSSELPDRMTREAIRAELPAYARVLGSTGKFCQDPVERYRHSIVLPYRLVSEGRRGIVVKIFLGEHRLTFAEREYQNLRSLFHHFASTTHLGVPRPIDHLPTAGAIVMERLFAPRLDRSIRLAARRLPFIDSSPVEGQCRSAGQWLAKLRCWQGGQGSDRESLRRDFRITMQNEFDEILTGARATGIAPALLERGRSFVEQFEPESSAFGPVHNDFAPYNAHITTSRTYFTDFSEMPTGLLEQCAGFFWASLEIMKSHPLLSERVLAQYQDAFLGGFGSGIEEEWKVWGLLRHMSYAAPTGARLSRRGRLWLALRRRQATRWLKRL